MAKNHLAIDINHSAVRLVQLSGDFVLREKTFMFEAKQDYRFRQQLEDCWNETGWKESDFDEVTLAWSGNQTTLVPVNVFNESDKDAIFFLSYGNQLHSEETDYNRIPMQGIVNVYSIPLWVKSFFVMRFPRVVIQHEGTHLIRGIFSGQTSRLKTKIVLHEHHFLIAAVKENNLQFYSSFDWSTPEDVVYYYSFFIQQQGYAKEHNEVEISAGSGAVIDLEQLKTALELLHKGTISIQVGNHLIEKYQQLCV